MIGDLGPLPSADTSARVRVLPAAPAPRPL